MREAAKKQTLAMPVSRAYFRAVWRYPWLLIVVLSSSIVIQAVGVILPIYLKQFIDAFSSGGSQEVVVGMLYGILAAYAGLSVIDWIAQRIERIAVQRIETQVMADLTTEAFHNLMHHSYAYFASSFVGTLTRRVSRYGRAFEQVFDGIVYNFLPAILFSAGVIFVLYGRSHVLGLVLLAWVLAFTFVQVLLTWWRQPIRLLRSEADSYMTGTLSDAVGNHSAVTLFAAHNYEEKRFGGAVDEWRELTRRSWNLDTLITGIQHAFGIAIEVGLLWIGINLWKQGILTVGDFVLIQTYVIMLLNQIWNIGNTLRRLYDSFADATEMMMIMDTPYGIKDEVGAKELIPKNGEISFDHVNFAFEDGRQILKNFSLNVAGGEKVALVGPSGAGKSTVTKLLLRLHDVEDGTITIDGQDISSVMQDSLRENISFVPQEPVLFHRTLRENIAYGRKNASEKQIIAAAKAAHCHEFISALSDGYDTYVGERGIKLSGGERQRVAIARAILKNAPILVLDEATSSLDSESESYIQEALAKLMEGKTVIAIAHRLSTIMKMDRIIVVKDGAVELSGTHEELLAQESNLYKTLWNIQAGSFIVDESEEEVKN